MYCIYMFTYTCTQDFRLMWTWYSGRNARSVSIGASDMLKTHVLVYFLVNNDSRDLQMMVVVAKTILEYRF